MTTWVVPPPIYDSADPAWPMNVTRSTSVNASCNACRKLLARVTWLVRDAYWSGSVATGVARTGTKATLEPGFEKAPTRHPLGGEYWYVRKKVGIRHPDAAERPSPKLELPAVVTCECGANNRLEGSLGQVWIVREKT
jgi:hypothetical protein